MRNLYTWITFISGIRKSVTCIEGICRPVRSNGYTDPCNEICGQASCADATDPGPCDLTNQLESFTGNIDLKLNGKLLFHLEFFMHRNIRFLYFLLNVGLKLVMNNF
jgi:hypothetical protein